MDARSRELRIRPLAQVRLAVGLWRAFGCVENGSGPVDQEGAQVRVTALGEKAAVSRSSTCGVWARLVMRSRMKSARQCSASSSVMKFDASSAAVTGRHPPSNMALQRTRARSAARLLWFAGRSLVTQLLPDGRSPLNARSFGVRKAGIE